MRKRVFALLCLIIPLHALADQLIIEPDMGRKPVLEMINASKHTLNLVTYGFTDKEILDALLKQKQRGHIVKVILEDEPYKAQTQNTKTIAAFKENKIDWQGNIPPYQLIHQKTLITDKNKAMVMTFNFTHSAFSKQRNFALIIEDKKRVNEINKIFAADWNHKPAPQVSADYILSPDNSRVRLLKLINDAQQEIDIYAQGISDYETVGALAKAARRGVTVNILTSSDMRKKQMKYLKNAGVNIHKSKKYVIHAKILMVDKTTAVIGSLNLTKPAIDQNRELSVITHQQDIINQLQQTFSHDWSE